MIAIIKYNAGNTSSVQHALNRLGYESQITDDPNLLRQADKVIFPGVGEASSAMAYLNAHDLDKVILTLKQPVLGICLGLQLMCAYSEEGNTSCLSIFDTVVKAFPKSEKVPHMGWNNFSQLTKHSLFENMEPTSDLYYVHSYYAVPNENTIATCDYINPFSAVMQKDNFYATQFHPEKSAGIGAQILKNFLEL